MPIEPREIDRMMGDPWRFVIPPTCLQCGYDLSGTGGNRCPECGIVYVRQVVEENARRTQAEIRRLKNMNDLVRAGFKVVLFGGVALAIGVLRAKHTPSLGEVARMVGVLCGVLGVFLGLNVLRVKRLPHWAVDYLPEQPNYLLGSITAVLAVILTVLCVYP
jgi:hypothetical protein